MFESQYHSLATITFLVQLLGILMVICYRLRGDSSRFNQIGILATLLVMAASTVCCLAFDTQAGITQGVTVVLVAVSATLDLSKSRRFSGF